MQQVAAGIFDGQELGRHLVDGDGRQAAIAADAVVYMDDRCANQQIGQVAEDLFGVAYPALTAPAARAFAEQFPFGDDCDACAFEQQSLLEWRNTEHGACRAGEEFRPAGCLGWPAVFPGAGCRRAFRAARATPRQTGCDRKSCG